MPVRLRVACSIAAASILPFAAACGGDTSTHTAPSCSYSVSSTSQAFGAAGGTGSVAVTAGTSCSWTARADSAWISITSGASGSGPGTVAFAVSENAATDKRTGGLTVADHQVSVSQDGAAVPCTYSLSSTSATHSQDGGTSSFSIAAPDGCRWTASASAAWISIAAGNLQGTGSGSIAYVVARNSDTASRSATISVADRTFVVNQSGDSSACQYGVSPTELSPCMTAPQMTATITTQAGCGWTATTNDPWITIASGASGSGSGAIVFSVAENWLAPRTGLVLVRWPTPTAGQNIRVVQAGCHYTVTPATIAIGIGGGSATFDVYQMSEPYTCGGPLQNGCIWTAVSGVLWITITSTMPRAGDDRVSISVSANTGQPARSGTIVVRDQILRVNQAGS